jgi:hypothetical protein
LSFLPKYDARSFLAERDVNFRQISTKMQVSNCFFQAAGIAKKKN